MHALRLPSLFATPGSRKLLSVVAPQDHCCCYVSRVKWLFSGLAIFLILVSCSRAAYATTYTVDDPADHAAYTGSLRYAANPAVTGDRTVFTPVPAGSKILKATSLKDETLNRSLAKVTMTMKIASSQQPSGRLTLVELRPLLPLGGLPLLPAAVLWFPETDDLSDLRIAGVPDEPISVRSRSHRWIRIGMVVLFAMGLLGMLFS